MAGEFKHKVVGAVLTRNDWEDAVIHEADNQVAGDLLYFNGSGWVRTSMQDLFKPYVVIDTSGNQAITTNTHINLNSEQLANTGYSLADNEITVNQDGIYLIMFSICYDITNTSGSTRGCVDAWIEDNSGGYSAVPGSYSRVYHREAAGGSGLSGQSIISLNNGNKIRLIATREHASTNIDTESNQVSLSILKVG